MITKDMISALVLLIVGLGVLPMVAGLFEAASDVPDWEYGSITMINGDRRESRKDRSTGRVQVLDFYDDKWVDITPKKYHLFIPDDN